MTTTATKLRGMARLLRRQAWLWAFVILLATWEGLSHWHIVGSTLLASPTEVWRVLLRFGGQQNIYVHAGYTIERALAGWGLTVAGGVVLGLLTGSFGTLYSGTEPIVEFARVIPPVLAFPLFLVAFNYGEAAYTWTIVFGCLPVMTLAVGRGVQGISREKLDLLRTYRIAGPVRAFTVVMEVLPSVFLGARLTLTMAVIIAVVTEMVFTPRNGWALGALARDAEMSFDTPTFYACVVVIALFGYLANRGIRQIETFLGVSARGEVE